MCWIVFHLLQWNKLKDDERGKCQKMTFNCKVEGKETTKFEKILKTKGTNFFPKTVFVWNAIGEGRGREEVNKKL